jgi:mRNA-degrading endonuclease RelE of RelBE toxin-antitoxin system
MKKVVFTRHAEEKFDILENHGFKVLKKQVEETLKNPDVIENENPPIFVAHKVISKGHVLRVVFKRKNNIIKVITFYPTRKGRYL